MMLDDEYKKEPEIEWMDMNSPSRDGSHNLAGSEMVYQELMTEPAQVTVTGTCFLKIEGLREMLRNVCEC
jgi:hypothetical protein